LKQRRQSKPVLQADLKQFFSQIVKPHMAKEIGPFACASATKNTSGWPGAS
jgi:hypothetical protein